MQLTLALLEPSPPARQSPRQELDADRAEALNILTRIIAQACETTQNTEATDE